jgi:hypothetical protein
LIYIVYDTLYIIEGMLKMKLRFLTILSLLLALVTPLAHAADSSGLAGVNVLAAPEGASGSLCGTGTHTPAYRDGSLNNIPASTGLGVACQGRNPVNSCPPGLVRAVISTAQFKVGEIMGHPLYKTTTSYSCAKP